MIELINVIVDNNGYFGCRAMIGGSQYSDFNYYHYGIWAGNQAQASAGNDKWSISVGATDPAQRFNGFLYVYQPLGTNSYQKNILMLISATASPWNNYQSGTTRINSAWSGISFYSYGGGTIVSGTFRLYGLKTS